MADIQNKSVEGGNALPHLCGSWPKGRDTVQIHLDEYKGKPIIDCRIWYSTAYDELKPGPKGLTLTLDVLPKLAQAINDALVFAKANALLPEGGGE